MTNQSFTRDLVDHNCQFESSRVWGEMAHAFAVASVVIDFVQIFKGVNLEAVTKTWGGMEVSVISRFFMKKIRFTDKDT